MKTLLPTLLLTTLTGCAVSQTSQPVPDVTAPVVSYYDYQLYSPSGQAVELANLPQSILDADIILVGEWHTHTGIHRFQTDLLKALSQRNSNQVLSMEQFTRDNQGVLDEYLAGEIGEQTLIKNANAWPNYPSDYRPLVEYAKANNLPVIAANAPKDLVRCIGRQGTAYLEKLDDKESQWVAQNIDTSTSPYKDKFLASMHHGSPAQTENQYAAQLTWDATMAESMVNFLKQNPGTKIMHTAGKFHTEQGLGTAAQILKLDSKLNIVVITPKASITSGENDYQLQVLTPPTRYVKQENRMAAYHNLAARHSDITCKP